MTDETECWCEETELDGEYTCPPCKARQTWRDGFDRGTKNTRERLRSRITALKGKLITAPEQNAIDKALAQIDADIEDHEGQAYHS